MKSDFLLAIAQLAAERNLPKDLVFKAVEAALLSTYKKDDSTKRYNLSVGILPASGEIKVFSRKTVVESPTNTWHEIALSDAREMRKDVEIGETIDIEIHPPDAGRIGVQTAKQVVMQRLREAEHEFIFGTFAHREGDILSGVIQRIDARQIIVDLGKAEGLLPMAEQVRAEHYRVGQRLMVFLVEVSQTNKGPRLLLSRTHPGLVRRLFELEVPEMSNGIVEVKSVAREPGSRTKIAVTARQDEIDPVGSCIGLRGIRIQNIINELQGEKVDVVQWHPDPNTFIASALSPAQVLRVETDPANAAAVVVVPDGQLSLAIGREGQNVRLAAKLTDWKIDIKSASVAEEEMAVRAAEEIALVGEIEEPAVEIEEEIVEEVIPVEAVLVEESRAPEGPQIRFAEDILPQAARERTMAEKSRKDLADAKPRGKKKAKRVKPVPDEIEDEIEVDVEP
ncbi:transcription termination factor NusA [Dehalococcoidia bacterium]|nr:transcription termination factor NusA [Dehalococcoidia bacterium]